LHEIIDLEPKKCIQRCRNLYIPAKLYGIGEVEMKEPGLVKINASEVIVKKMPNYFRIGVSFTFDSILKVSPEDACFMNELAIMYVMGAITEKELKKYCKKFNLMPWNHRVAKKAWETHWSKMT